MSSDPTFIYHYTSQRGLLGICESGSIWATEVRYLNDASEFTYAVELTLALLEDYPCEYQEAVRPAARDIRDGKRLLGDEGVYVASFSQHGDLLSQWRAYCPESGGVSIAFNVSLLQQVAARRGFRLVQCIYDRHEQMRILRRSIEEAAYLSVPEQARERLLQRLIENAPLMKQPAFREEAEWRLVSASTSVTNPRVRHRPGRSMLLPYLELSLLDDAGLISIDHVVLGPTPHPSLARTAVAGLLLRLRRDGRLGATATDPNAVKETNIPFRAW